MATGDPGSAAPPDRHEVARALREIARLMEAEGANPFKVRAFERGARAIEGLGENLGSLVAEGRITDVRGIGPALARTVEELVRTGRSPMLDRLRESMPPGVLELRAVLSLPRIRAVHEALGITTMAELREAAEAGRLRKVKGFGAVTEAKILEKIRGLVAQGDVLLLFEADERGAALLQHVHACPDVEKAELAGALRRRRETVDRLDLVVATERPSAVSEHLERAPSVTSVLERHEHGLLLRLAEGLNVNVVLATPADFATALHAATGSAVHLEELRAFGRPKGISLDDAGLTIQGRRRRPRSEAAIYETFGLPLLPPELREGAGEVDAAAAGELPDGLLELADIRGMVHCHTTYSDGRATVEEMARGADELGMQYLTITDHSPRAHYANGVTIDRLKRQWEDIDRAQEKVRVRLLRGTESDILADGSLDYPDEILESFDVIVASVHERHRMDVDQMTARVIGAMRQPWFKVWGHALGRLLRRRPPFEVHLEQVLDAAAESRAAIEVNGDPHRMDMEARWIRLARKRGLRFVVSVDAHSVDQMQNLRFGVDMARRGWLRKGEVLNTLDVEAFRAAVKP